MGDKIYLADYDMSVEGIHDGFTQRAQRGKGAAGVKDFTQRAQRELRRYESDGFHAKSAEGAKTQGEMSDDISAKEFQAKRQRCYGK